MSIHSFVYRLLHSTKIKLWISLVFVVVVAFAVGAKNLHIASDYKIFFDKDDSDLLRLEKLQEIYSKTENVFIMVNPKEGTIYNLETITLLHELTEALWRVPYTSRVDSLTNYPYARADEDDIYIEEFVYDETNINPERLKIIADKAPREEDLLNKLITEDGKFSALNLSLHFPNIDTKEETLAVEQAVTSILHDFQQRYPDHQFSNSGIAMMNAAFIKAAKKDLLTLIPIMMLAVLIAAGLILGSMKAAALIFVLLLLSFAAALGTAGWLGINLSAPSISAPIIMYTVIVASCIHILNYVRKRQLEGASPREAVLDSYEHNSAPIFLSHITTIIGFLSMNFSDSPPFRDLGNIVVFGVLASLLLVFTALPYFLAGLRFSGNASNQLAVNNRVADAIADFVVKRKYTCFTLCLLLSVLLSTTAFNNELNDNLLRYFDEKVEFRKDAERIDEQFSGLYNIDYSLNSQQANGIYQPEFLAFVDKFEGWLALQEGVVSIDSPLHRMKDLNRLMHGDDNRYYSIPNSKESAAQNFLLYEMSLPQGKDTSNYISLDKSRMKINVRLRNSSSRQMIRLESTINHWLQNNQPQTITIEYSSPGVIFSHIGDRSIHSLLKGAGLALLIISLALIFVFRSLLVGLLSLIPNILPIVAAFGVWHFLSGQISMGLAGVAAMAIGIVVDDTVHFIFQYIKALRDGCSPEESVKITFEKTMPAIILSSLLLVAGFMILVFSSFEKNADIGLLTGVTILLALIFDLFLLPVLAMLFIRKAPFHKPSSQVVKVVSQVTSNV